jgi:hypothetical protein
MGSSSSNASLLERIDAICAGFDEAWKQGQRPEIEEYLESVPEPERSKLFEELLKMELAYRRRSQETFTDKEYRQRFPGQAGVIDVMFAPAAERGAKADSAAAGANRHAFAADTDIHEQRTDPGQHSEGSKDNSTRASHPADLPLLPGYEILGELGRGGMGVVYKARQVRLQRLVALKMILAGAHAGPQELARFRREAEAVAQLQHPHIVQIYEVGEQKGQPYFSLEFVDGGSLAQKLAGTPLPAYQAAQLVETLARAVHAAHERDIIHRDLKPANVLLTAHGTPKVTDFGLAKRLDAGPGLTESGAIVGTPSYMAPEQARGKTKEIGPACDVYALGAIFYELLTGRPPFRAETPLDTVLQVLQDEPVAPSRLQPKLPRDLETICLKAMAKTPARRYATAQALAEDLRRFLNHEPITARSVGAYERVTKWVRRRPMVASLLAALLICLTVAGGSVVYGLRQDVKRQTEIAIQERANAQEQRRLAKEAQDERDNANNARAELEATLAQSLLRPLGHQEGMVNEFEREALRELAENPSRRVWLLFIQKALDRPHTARQLRNRRELALHATVGLDRSRRQQIEELLLARLRDDRTGPRVREDCALVGTALGNASPAFAGAVARALIDGMAKTSDAFVGFTLVDGLGAVSARLSADDAQAAARALSDAVAKKSDPYALRPLARGLGAALVRLSAADAAPHARVAARALTAAMAQTPDDYALFSLEQGFQAVAPRLSTEDARAAAHALSEAMAKSTKAEGLRPLTHGLVATLARLSRDEAAPYARVAARALTAAMAQNPTPENLRALTRGLEAVLPWLSTADIQAVARILSEAVPTAYYINKPGLAQGLGMLFPHLSALEAVHHAGATARDLSTAMARSVNDLELSSLAWGLERVSARVSAEDAEAAAHALMASMAKTSNTATGSSDIAGSSRAQGLKAVSTRLSTNGATAAARALSGAITKTTDAYALRSLAQGLGAALARLSPQEAAQYAGSAARALSVAKAPTSNPFAVSARARGLGAVLVWLSTDDAAPYAGAATHALTAAMAKASESSHLHSFYEGLEAISAQLSTEDARAAARALIAAMAKTSDPYALLTFAQALRAVSVRLSAEEAALYAGVGARALATAMTKPSGPNDLDSLANGLEAVGACLGAEDAGVAARALAAAMAKPIVEEQGSDLVQRDSLKAAARLSVKDTAAATFALRATYTVPGDPYALIEEQVLPNDQFTLRSLVHGLEAVGSRLSPKDAEAASRVLIAAMADATDPARFASLAQGLQAISIQLKPDEAAARAIRLADALGELISPDNLLPALATLTDAAQPLPSRLSTQQLVDLLKMPTCVGSGRTAILDLLGQHFKRRFADQWEIVGFAEAHLPNLDLKTPTKRSQVGSTQPE